MTTRELIQKLKAYPPEMPVMLAGYEGGYNDIDTVEQIAVKRNVNPEWWYGAHAESDDKDAVQGVLLKGENTQADDSKVKMERK